MIPPPWTPKQTNHPGTIVHVIDGADGYTPDMFRKRNYGDVWDLPRDHPDSPFAAFVSA